MAAVVPAVDEGADLDHEIADGWEAAAVDGLAFDDGEPDLNQIQPGSEVGVKWTWILGLPASQALTFGCLWAA